ncbi:MAG: hypothetical protein BWK78_06285 [Thiotrichaceae bacterium IS1]|nr:MAG: hypothetical protein BWK78_06285 [Thiotrichaceae bacterium IS1]
MNLSEKNITAFAHLVKTIALTEADKTGLLQMINDSKDSHETLSQAILKWCKTRSLEEALDDQSIKLFPATEMGGGKPPSKEAGKQACLDLLRNAIQTSGPPKHVSIPTTDKPGEVPKVSEKKP